MTGDAVPSRCLDDLRIIGLAPFHGDRTAFVEPATARWIVQCRWTSWNADTLSSFVKRGEGLNLMDFASRYHGMAFGTEMGMYGGFEDRVGLGMTTVQTAVSVFEERYR